MRVRIDRSPERTSTWTGRPLALGATAWAVLMASVPSFSIASVALLGIASFGIAGLAKKALP